jgi:hypothetical protein
MASTDFAAMAFYIHTSVYNGIMMSATRPCGTASSVLCATWPSRVLFVFLTEQDFLKITFFQHIYTTSILHTLEMVDVPPRWQEQLLDDLNALSHLHMRQLGQFLEQNHVIQCDANGI